MSGESKTDYEAKVAAYNAAYYAAYNAGMRRAVESGFDTVAWKCRRPLKVTYQPSDGTPLCVSKESFAESEDQHARRNAAYAAGMRRAVDSGFDKVLWKCPDILKVTYPPPQYTPLCVSKESYAAEPPKGFFARYWLLIVVLVLVLVFVMLYLRRRKTDRLV